MIYLEFVPTRGVTPKRFEECQCEDDDVRLHYRTWVSSDGHYRWLRGSINPLFMEHRANTLLTPSTAFWIFCSCDLSLLSHLLNCNSLEATQVEMLGFIFDFNSI